MTPLQRGLTKVAVFIGCAIPFALLVARATGIGGLSLGANPVFEIIDTLGKTALNILLITLAVSPLRRLTKWNVLVIYRRMLGLFSFFYLLMHVTAYVLDLGLAWSTIFVDVTQRPYTIAGMIALLLMIPLAVTSTRGFQRRLKRNWTRLHKVVYAIGVLGVTHYLWQSKLDDALEPLIYAGILSVLLGERLIRWVLRMGRSAAASRSQTATGSAQ